MVLSYLLSHLSSPHYGSSEFNMIFLFKNLKTGEVRQNHVNTQEGSRLQGGESPQNDINSEETFNLKICER